LVLQARAAHYTRAPKRYAYIQVARNAEVVALAKEGHPANDLAAQFDISGRRVRQVLARAGVFLQPQKEEHHKRVLLDTFATRQGGATLEALAAVAGVGPSTVQYRLKAARKMLGRT
jgi:hypothetical protein